mgnify:CR=1 FL=1
MCEVMNYIFGSLSNSETAIRSIRKSLNKQARYNRKLSTLALIMTVNPGDGPCGAEKED